MDEAGAIRGAKQGDRDAFRWLVERDGDLVRRTAYLLLHDRELADELAQEAFLAAWQGIGSLLTPTGFRPWVMRILINKISSHTRRRRFRLLPLEGLSPAEDPVDTGPEPAELALRDEDRRELAAALGALPGDWQQALVLRYYSELSVPEIARTLDVPEGTVKSRLHRALERLRIELSGKPQRQPDVSGQIPRRGEQR